jgi:hypothetical protein
MIINDRGGKRENRERTLIPGTSPHGSRAENPTHKRSKKGNKHSWSALGC